MNIYYAPAQPSKARLGGVLSNFRLPRDLHKRGPETESTFKGHSGYYSLLQLKWLLYVLNILDQEIWKPHLKEINFTTGYKSCNCFYSTSIFTTSDLPKVEAKIDGLYLNVLHI